MLKEFYLIKTFYLIKNKLPSFIMKDMLMLLPVYIISSLFEMLGLFVVFPVINSVLVPNYISENFYLSYLYTQLGFTNELKFVLFLFISIFLVFVIKNVVVYFVYHIQTRISFRLATAITVSKYKSYLQNDYQFHLDSNAAELLRNITLTPYELVIFIVLPFVNIINELIMILFIIVVISIYDPMLFLSVILFSFPLLLLYNKVYKKKLKDVSERRNIENAAMYRLGMISLEGYREIKLFNKINFFQPGFKKAVNNYSTSLSKVYLLNLFSPKIIETVAVACLFGIFISGYLLGKDIKSLAQFLVFFSIAAYRIIPSLNKIILNANNIKASMYVFDHFQDLKRFELERNEEVEAINEIEFNQHIRLENIAIRFRDKSDFVLKNVNLEINKGDRIGLIGQSGSGKTTLLNILLRLYKEDFGCIYIDNQKLTDNQIGAWYNLISYIPQNIFLMDGTIEENIAFGVDSENIDQVKLKRVIEQAQLSEYILNLPNGISTLIGDKGIKISGGQRQRVGIARSLYHGGKVLLMDEATSSLDMETESSFTDSLIKLKEDDYTLIIIAHRIQSLRNCNKIYKVENGTISSNYYTYEELV